MDCNLTTARHPPYHGQCLQSTSMCELLVSFWIQLKCCHLLPLRWLRQDDPPVSCSNLLHPPKKVGFDSSRSNGCRSQPSKVCKMKHTQHRSFLCNLHQWWLSIYVQLFAKSSPSIPLEGGLSLVLLQLLACARKSERMKTTCSMSPASTCSMVLHNL